MGKDKYLEDGEEQPDKGDKGDETERGNWGGQLDFLLSAIGYAVGLGNVWRFPYQAYANGGASFLIPYVVTLVLAGLPLFFMEMALGQFSSLGPISVWRAVPMFKGLGWAMVMISLLTAIYYNMIIAYTVYYTFASFTGTLPWAECKPEWVDLYNCRNRDEYNATIKNITETWCGFMKDNNDTMGDDYIRNCSMKATTPAEVYFEKIVLDMSEGVDIGTSEIKWQLVLCLLFAWIVIFLCLSKGIKSSGKVVYVTATFPYVILLILLIRNATLDGALEGIKFYIIPDFSKLANSKVWYAAATQIFYSLGVAFGGLETMASYNKFKNNVYRDAVLVACLNCGTSVFAGFVIFSVIGHMSVRSGIPVSEVATQGPGLAFIAYPEGLALMPVSQLWSVLFFLMLFTLGLDSQFAMMETCITAITDEFPWFGKGKRKLATTGFFCILLFLLGLPQCSRAGIYILELFSWYCAGFSLMAVSILECIAIAWVYGFKRFSKDIAMMIGHEPNIYWKATWVVLTPAMITFIFIFSIVDASPITYNSYVYPLWVDRIGIGMVIISVVCIPIVGLVEYCKAHEPLETLKRVTNPQPGWGPAAVKHRTGRYGDDEGGADLVTVDQTLPSYPQVVGQSNSGYDDGATKF